MSFKAVTAKEMIEILISEGGIDHILTDGSHLLTHPDHNYSLWCDNNETWYMIGKDFPLPPELMS